MKRIQRAVREVERDLRKGRGNRRRGSGPRAGSQEEAEIEEAIDNLVFDLNESVASRLSDSDERHGSGKPCATGDLPEIPRDWKVKLREKVLRNMEASIHEIHIRLEVPQGGLDCLSRLGVEAKLSVLLAPSERDEVDRSFAVGFTLESFVMRTANEQWEVGSHDKRNAVDGSAMSSVKGQLGPNPYLVKNNKIGYFTGFSIYWDNDPPLILAETDVLQGNFRKLTADKLLLKVSTAMEALFQGQEPGNAVRQSLNKPAVGYVA